MNVKNTHRAAMNLMQQAIVLRETGKEAMAVELFVQTFELEKQAALMLLTDFDKEPTRSILYRSAASLAIDCGKYREAEKLVTQGLAGNPPEDIAEELRNLYEDVNQIRLSASDDSMITSTEPQEEDKFTIEGTLRAANAVNNKITIVEKISREKYYLEVPEGLNNIVKEYWDVEVFASISKNRQRYSLLEIAAKSV